MKFYTNIRIGKLPELRKKSKVIVFFKPNKPPDLPENYRPISLLSCSYKLFERVILARISEVIDANFPKEHAGFRKNRSCCDQVLALTNYIELGYEKGLKTGVVFLDLSAAYDTVWKRGVMYKLSKILSCKTTLQLIMSMLSDRNFQVVMNGKTSRKRIVKNGLPRFGAILFSVFLYFCILSIQWISPQRNQENSSMLKTMPSHVKRKPSRDLRTN